MAEVLELDREKFIFTLRKRNVKFDQQNIEFVVFEIRRSCKFKWRKGESMKT